MAHPDCGLFRLAEDYRDHLPCEKCEPSRAATASHVAQQFHADQHVCPSCGFRTDLAVRTADIPGSILDAIAGLERAYTTPAHVSGVPGPQQARGVLIDLIAAAVDAARKGGA